MATKNPTELCGALIARMRTMQIATLGEDNEPHCGYTPYLLDGKDMLIFTSRLAEHTRDLLRNPIVGVMMIDDEQDSKNLFARCRVRYQCNAHVIEPTDEQYKTLLDRYEAHQGKVVTLIRQLPDFVLFRLVPTSGIFVMGFGDAYRIGGPEMDEFVHVTSG